MYTSTLKCVSPVLLQKITGIPATISSQKECVTLSVVLKVLYKDLLLEALFGLA